MPAFEFIPAHYPARPGCYIMKNDEGRVLYIGKSKNIRSRLRAYFNGADKRRRIPELAAQIAEIGYIVVGNEQESLILENNLIKINKPPYNRALKKENSGYAYLQLTQEAVPRLTAHYRDRRSVRAELQPSLDKKNHASSSEGSATARQHRFSAKRTSDDRTSASESEFPSAGMEPSVQRFGPFVSSRFREAVIAFVTEHYRLRTCRTLPKRACLEYHLGKCSGVCEGLISQEDYAATAMEAARLLSNQGEKLIAAMYAQMQDYAEKLAFEKAEHMLRHIRILERTPERQIVDRETTGTQEAVYFGEDRVVIAVLHEGMLHRLETLPWMRGEEGTAACDYFLIKRYTGTRPEEIIVSEIVDPQAVRAALRRRGELSVRITLPKRGLKRELLLLCKRNLEEQLGCQSNQNGEAG